MTATASNAEHTQHVTKNERASLQSVTKNNNGITMEYHYWQKLHPMN